MSSKLLYGGVRNVNNLRVDGVSPSYHSVATKSCKAVPLLEEEPEIVDQAPTESKQVSMPAIRGPQAMVSRFRPIQPPRPKLPKRRQRIGKSWRDLTAGDAADYGVKAYEMVKKVISLINVEEKQFDVGSTGIPLTTTSIVANLSNIAQGTDYNQRVGDSILAQRLEFNCSFEGSAARGNNFARVMIVTDKEYRGTDPAMTEVLESNGSNEFLALSNALYKQRFIVHYDQKVALTNVVGLATTGTSTGWFGQVVIPPRLDVRFNRHILYDATAAADASGQEGALFLMAVSHVDDGPILRYQFRLTFTDN